jgi:hypothetical protein
MSTLFVRGMLVLVALPDPGLLRHWDDYWSRLIHAIE